MEETPKPTTFIPIGLDLVAPREFTFRVEEEGLYSLEADVVYEQPVGGRMGHFVVDRLTIRRREEGPPITTEGLRELPVAAFLRLAVEGSLLRVGPREYDSHTSSWRRRARKVQVWRAGSVLATRSGAGSRDQW